MLFFHVCQQEELFWMKIVYAFMFDGPKRAELRLANSGSAEGAGEESRASLHRSRKYNLEAPKPALDRTNPVQNGGAGEYVVLNQHSPMKPLAGECRLGKYNFSILLVILL